MQPNKLPFQYLMRGQQMQYLSHDLHAHAVDQRDRDLEDYLGVLYEEIVVLRNRIAALEGP